MPKKIKKTIVKTRYIQEALTLYAQKNFIPLSECDFTINKVDTYIKCNATESFELYDKEIQKEFFDREKIINEHVEFHQIFTITMMHKQQNSSIDLEYGIDYSKFSTHPILILSPESKISYKAYKPIELLKLLFKECNKIKARHNILINIFDEEMKQYLKLFIKYIYAGKFVKKVKIPLFNGIEPVVTRPSKLIFWFKEKTNMGEVIEVQENELLVEYKKPIYGQNGLNAFGEYLDSKFTSNVDDLQARVDEKSIKIEETQSHKRYISRIRGYVHYNEKELAVDNTIKISEISRNRDLVNDTEENNIEVIVTQHDTNRDTIKEGVTLISEYIHVDGFVGANSRLEAVTLNIDGATHHSYMQYAKYAHINRHKGTLRCHEATISLLEGGKVYASKVNIKDSIGGSIYAQDVTVEHVKNNLKIYASNSITIRLVSGEDNVFKINYKDVPVLESKLTYIEHDIKEFRHKLKEAKRHSLSSVDELQKQIQQLKKEQQDIEESYINAKITIKEPLRGLNTISFTIDNSHEIIYKTENRVYSPFYLEVKENLITLHPVEKSITLND